MARATKTKAPKAEAADAPFVHDAIAVRTVNRRDRSYNKFQWPTEIGALVECPDWSPRAECGGGFHGLLDGIGHWGLTWRDDGMIWQVVGVKRDECVSIDEDKVKFPRCVLLSRGAKADALKLIIPAMVAAIQKDATAKVAVSGHAAATGDSGHAAATGYSGHAAATGYSGHAAATGDSGHAAATGDSGHAAATGYRGHAAATGDSGHAAATGCRGHAAATGDSGHAAATGYSGHAAATGYSGHAAATGDSGHAAATGDRGHAAATGYSGHAAATGDSGHAAATGDSGHAAATGCRGHAAATGDRGVAVSLGYEGAATAGATGWIVLAHCSRAYPYPVERVERFKVGEDGVEAGKTYKLSKAGKPVEVK